MKRLGISFFVLFVLCFPLHAQEVSLSEPAQEQPDEQVQPWPGPPPTLMNRIYQLTFEAEQQGKTLFGRMDEEGYKTLIGLSEAQVAHLDSQTDAVMQEIEEPFMKFQEQMFQWNKLPEEEYQQFENDFIELHTKIYDKLDATFRETLTPVQLQNALEYELATPSFVSMVLGDENATLNLSLYDALGLSEEQKKKMLELQEESDPEMQESLKVFIEIVNSEQISCFSGVPSEAERQKFEEILKIQQEKVKAILQKMQEKVNALLTPEQKAKLASIREEIPKKLASIREELEKKAKENPVDDSWKDSWKPGDPLPEGAVPPQRKPRFPMGF